MSQVVDPIVNAKLNKAQEKAVTFGEGPLLIVAGAGTGKTAVITHRIARLIVDKKIKVNEILALTFTEKAAGEMEERVDRLLPYGYVDLWISTFHSFCEKILKQHALDIGLPNDFKLLNETEQWLLARQNLDKFNLEYYRPLGNPTKFIRALIKHFSRCKDEEVSPEDYLKYAEELKLNLDGAESGATVTKRKNERTKEQSQSLNVNGQLSPADALGDVGRVEEIANAYHVYQQLLLQNDALDFGDLINYTLKLFRSRPHILKMYQNQFKYILVDEFQDTNYAQYELVKLLAGDRKNLTVVGDDDQCLPGGTLVSLPNQKKKIKDIKAGEKVITAVGKGHLGVAMVNKVFKNKKSVLFRTITTERGRIIKVTDNHKMFCYVPRVGDKKDYFVYLMYKQELGWRLGITNDLALRLRLERSADNIIGIKTCRSEEEARYSELLFSLKYGIPTNCFKEREGLMIKNEWLNRLYSELDVAAHVKKLANDLNIDLESPHYCLAAVNRGGKSRIKINVEMCYRNYRSKDHVKSGKMLILNNQVLHCVSLETSDKKIITKLKRNGFKLLAAKKGWRVRISSVDIAKIDDIAVRLQNITNGFIEYKFKVGRLNYQTLPATIMLAKNLLKGHYLPIQIGNDIKYDKIISIKENKTKATVYDLSIDKTHNFIANGVVVHNSVYRFRGASVSNILEFKKDFPQSSEVVLTENYRSSQNILDLSYDFIQLNNPYRLEAQLAGTEIKMDGKGRKLDSKISKKLKAAKKETGIIENLHTQTLDDEVNSVIQKILELKNKAVGKDGAPINWSDFAILARANNSALPFLSALKNAMIPYQFMALRGLYIKPVVVDIINYFKLLDNYHESAALFRIASLPIFKISDIDFAHFNYFARQKTLSLFEAFLKADMLTDVSEESKAEVKRLLSYIEKHSALTRQSSTCGILKAFLEDTGYLKFLESGDESEMTKNFSFLNQFYQKIKDFEKENPESKLKDFMSYLDLEVEAGETGSLTVDMDTGDDAVKIMTVHAAKGLEFKYVFIVNLVDLRFPTTERTDAIELPDALVKEIVPEGDIHLQEERRLFYVAMTRAKEGLFFTSAEDYGGSRKKKPSRFLYEARIIKQSPVISHENIKTPSYAKASAGKQKYPPATQASGLLALRAGKNTETQERKNVRMVDGFKQAHQPTNLCPFGASPVGGKSVPAKFSYSQLAAFEKCPLQYKYNFVLHIPVFGKPALSFGQTMHLTLQKFFNQMIEKQSCEQKNLFESSHKNIKIPPLSGASEKYKNIIPTLDELLKIYEESWIDNWYANKKEKEEYREKGKKILKEFYAKIKANPPRPKVLESGFNFKLHSNPPINTNSMPNSGDDIMLHDRCLEKLSSPHVGGEVYTIKGKIDRIDEVEGGIEIIDYKTGKSKAGSKISADDKEQLLIYQIAVEEIGEDKPQKLTFYYLDDNQEVSFIGTDEEKDRLKEKIIATIKNIQQSNFPPKPSPLCEFCDFKHICEFRQA